MDSWCVSMKHSPYFFKGRSGFVSNGDERFWGKRIKGSVNNTDLNNVFAKRLKIARSARMIKPGTAFSVLTSENGKGTLVSFFKKLANYYMSEFVGVKHFARPEIVLL